MKVESLYWYAKNSKDKGDFYTAEGRAAKTRWIRVPLRYDHISSPFNPKRMHPVLKRVMPHNGTDYAASTGTIVRAAADGKVTFAGVKGPNGNLVSIKHDGGYATAYAHLHRIQRGIKRGKRIKQGDIIGAVGTTGRSSGPHLHFAVKKNGRFIDPIKVLKEPGQLLSPPHLGTFKRHIKRLNVKMGID